MSTSVPRPRDLSSGPRAFTLVEILVVVVILGIASAIIIPQIGSRDDLRAASAARMLMADLIYAQNRAIAFQQRHYVVFDAVNNRYALRSGAWPGTTLTHPVQKVPYEITIGTGRTADLQGVRIHSVNLDGQTILEFDALGTPRAVNASGVATDLVVGQIALRAGTHTTTITVEPYTGEINVQ